MADLPRLALSVRQPWAWGIFNGKDVENRTVRALRHMNFAGVDRIAIHAAKGMTQFEYECAAEFMQSIGVSCPPAHELLRGGIIGSVAVRGTVSASPSKWFMGPRGIVLADPQACDFIPAVGALGLFEWREADASIVPTPAQWMLPRTATTFSERKLPL